MAALKDFLRRATPAESPLTPMSPKLIDAFSVSLAVVLASGLIWVSLIPPPFWLFWLSPDIAIFFAALDLVVIVFAVYLMVETRLFKETNSAHIYQAYGTVIIGAINGVAIVALIVITILFFAICAALLIALFDN